MPALGRSDLPGYSVKECTPCVIGMWPSLVRRLLWEQEIRRFESCHSDMAKFDVGDSIRLTRNMQFGNVQIKKNTKGEIKKIIKGGFFSKNEYVVRWKGVGFDITMIGESNIAPDGDLSWF